MLYMSIGKAAKMLGVHRDTLRRWIDKGIVESYRTPSKQRKVSVDSITALAGKSSAFVTKVENPCNSL